MARVLSSYLQSCLVVALIEVIVTGDTVLTMREGVLLDQFVHLVSTPSASSRALTAVMAATPGAGDGALRPGSQGVAHLAGDRWASSMPGWESGVITYCNPHSWRYEMVKQSYT